MQGRMIGGPGGTTYLELQVKNRSNKKNSSLTLMLTRTLYLPGQQQPQQPATVQISDTLTTVPFRGPEYIIPPGAEGVANPVFDVPKLAWGVQGGTLDREREEDGGQPRQTESLFKIRCEAEVEAITKARKVRCARENPDDPQQTCKHCITLGILCTYDYQPKKRGPPNLYLRRLQEAAAAAAATHPQSDSASDNDIESPISSLANPSQNSIASANITLKSPPSFLEPTINQLPPISTIPIPPSRYPIAADTYHSHYTPQSTVQSSSKTNTAGNGIRRSSSHPRPKVEDQSYISSPSDNNSCPLYNWSYKQRQLLPIPAPTTVPPLSYYYRPR
ncbi:hypothetical protein BYT27DRAFT_7252207 [Phlegmacium glaucopus]|nr:hypothetical protein BYT27DRAFT_7252207 [Phlegmacium glaucopus]